MGRIGSNHRGIHSPRAGPLVRLPSLLHTTLPLTTFRCFNNRRRRRRGAPPMYGTAWLPAYSKYGGQYSGQNGQTYYQNQPYHGGAPAPPYAPPMENQATGNTFNSNDGYYGNHGYGQQSGIELQEPTSAYQPQRGGDPVYDAPAGPPPGKGDYVVR
jgi:hypothetical protein